MQIMGFLVDIRETVIDINRGLFGLEMRSKDAKTVISNIMYIIVHFSLKFLALQFQLY